MYLINYLVDKLYSFINNKVIFKVKLLYYDVISPCKSYPGSAGYDICSIESVTIEPGSRRLIATGISLEVPEYYYVRVAPRSGLSVRGIDIGAGVVDSSYRGEVKVLLINNSKESYNVQEGDRIAQLIMERCGNAEITILQEYDELSMSERGENGFGSSGNSNELIN
jgi:dUTP pyrophosphatase